MAGGSRAFGGTPPTSPKLDPSGVAAPPGAGWSREWTELVDAAIRNWLASLSDGRSPPVPGLAGLAIVALGSYARRELCPASDIDLLLLHDGWGDPDLQALVQAVCYPLWDAGLSVGHAVRTPREAVRSAAERVDTATALTDRRLVAGDHGLLDELAVRVTRWLRRNGGRVLADLAALDAERHARSGDTAGMLEPDLKDGVGGLRDLHSLRWAGACVLGEVGLDPLVGARYLGAIDRRELAQAGEALLAARCALHLVTGLAGARRDWLRLDLQDEVAAVLGMAGGDDLLRRVGLATRTISHLHGRTWPILLADACGGRRRRHPPPEVLSEGVRLVDGLVEVDADRTLANEPSVGLRAVAAAAVRGTHLGRMTAVRLRREAAELGSIDWDAPGREALLVALRQGWQGSGALVDADSIGLPVALLPGWERIRGLPQRNPLHRYDLDTHGFRAAHELVAIGEGALDPTHREIWAGLADRGAGGGPPNDRGAGGNPVETSLNWQDTVLLGTWLHDVGKGLPGDHSVVGEALARDWVAHMGFDARCVRRVGQLVRLHLLLPDVATRRDLDDPDEILAVARQVGDVETLDGLYLLSLADSRATGPAAWSAWKDGLLAKLCSRVRHVLVDDLETLRRELSLSKVVVEAHALLGGDLDGLDALLDALPTRYLLAASAEQVAEHARLLLPLPDPGTLRVLSRPGPADGTVTVTVVAGDRCGLVADCAGVLAAHGLGVLDARMFTRADGVALDWFVVRISDLADWDRVSADLRRAAAGELDVAAAVARREQRRDERPPPLAAPIPVEVTVEPRSDHSRIEVRGPDAPGVLYRLARALTDEGLDILGARVDTLGPQVHDVFFVRGHSSTDLVRRISAAYRRDPTHNA
ncbi:MAG: ACT domain-containing protein [Egibacteraceae bacterium]